MERRVPLLSGGGKFSKTIACNNGEIENGPNALMNLAKISRNNVGSTNGIYTRDLKHEGPSQALMEILSHKIQNMGKMKWSF